MIAVNRIFAVRWGRLLTAGLPLLALCACEALGPTTTPHLVLYSLDSPHPHGAASAASSISAGPTAPAAAPTLIINPPHAGAGFDSSRIVYVREAHKPESFAHSRWVDPPARMLAPLLVAAVENTGAFRAVALTPSAAAGDLRLDTEIVRLQHEFHTRPSSARFTLRAYLVDSKTRRVLASREFDAVVPSASEDPQGGVVAANRAVQDVLASLAAFCAEAARGLPMAK
jgi:cholesterol transport system auxiliary component